MLLFDDTGRGLERAESYLQYNADNFFSPIHRNTDKLGVYYFSTDNARLVEKARECGRMFTPCLLYTSKSTALSNESAARMIPPPFL